MIEFSFKFQSDQSCIFEVENKLKLSKKDGVNYEYYKSSEINNDLIPINKRIPIRELGVVEESILQTTIHLYELSPIKNNCDYYDFKLCTETNHGELQIQTSVFKILIENDMTLYDLHEAVYRRTLYRIRNSGNEEQFSAYFKNDIQAKKSRYYKIEFDFTPVKDKKCPIHKINKQHVCEIDADESFAFKLLLKAQSNKKLSFRIVNLWPESSKMSLLQNNCQTQNPIIIESLYDCNFESCLSKFVADEIYSDYNCDKCNKVENCIMKTKMSSLPKYLIFQLMRFQSDSSDAKLALKKKDEFVEFPMNGLDLSGIYSGKKSSQNCIYDLYGVIHHTSTIGIGHYYATIRDDINSDDWHLFNDEIVEQCTEQDVVNENAYVLFYVKREADQSTKHLK